MSFAGHGNWCGPGWSAGQWKDAKDLTEEDKQIPAVDELDQACKNHDIAIAEGDPDANPNFYEEATAAGWFGTAAAALVAIGGPSSHSYLRGDDNMPTQRLTREQKRKQIQERAREKQIKQEKIWDAESTDIAMENLRKRKASNELDDTDNREREVIDLVEEEEKEDASMNDATADQEVIESLVDNNGNSNFVTPQRNPPQIQPSLTREERPLRGERSEGSLTNLLTQVDTNMDVTEAAPMAMRAAAASGDSGNPSKNRSVAVKYDSRQELGFFTETRTAMLPVSIYFSINKLDAQEPVRFTFVLNDTYNIFREQIFIPQNFPDAATNAHVPSRWTTTVPASSGTNAHTQTSDYRPAQYVNPVVRSKGVSSDMAYSLIQSQQNGVKMTKPVGVNYGRALQFPFTTKSDIVGTALKTTSGNIGYGPGKAAGDYPMAWRDYYERCYRMRHVMKTEWRLTMENAQEGVYHRGVVLEAVDTITNAPLSSSYITPISKPLAQMVRFKNIKETRLKALNAQGGSTVNVLSGVWTDNSSRRRDVVDEENISDWYPTGAKNGPSGKEWEERQTLLFYNDQFSGNQNGYFNCKLDLMYHVQYRDLKPFVRYASYEDADQVVLNINETTFPTGQPLANQWPTDDEVDDYNESIMLANTHNHVK